jgi:hypothetical protein
MRKFIIVIFIFCCTSSIFAETVILDTPGIKKQKTPVWCWAASIQNVLSAYSVSVSQEQVVTATYGTVRNLPLFDPRLAVINLLKASAQVAPQGKVVHPFYVAGPPRPDVLIRELAREESPLMVFYRNPQGGGHVVVCYGVEYRLSRQGPIITKVFIKDPAEGKNKEWGGRQLAQLWSATIFLRVTHKPKRQFNYNGVSYKITSMFDIRNRSTRQVEGRVWFFNEDGHWHLFDLRGNDRGAVQ